MTQFLALGYPAQPQVDLHPKTLESIKRMSGNQVWEPRCNIKGCDRLSTDRYILVRQGYGKARLYLCKPCADHNGAPA